MSAWATIGGIGLNWLAQESANRANVGMAREQMGFQERMAKNAHQYEVADLKKAGLNPVLSAGGSGASVPSGASATVSAPQIDLPAIQNVAALALKEKEVQNDSDRVAIERNKAIVQNMKGLSENEKVKAETILKQRGKIRAETEGEIYKILKDAVQTLRRLIL